MPSRFPILAALGLALGSAASLAAQPPASAADQVPSDPAEVRPLLIGSEVPKVTLRDMDGKTAELDKLVAAKPSVLIFYRGGW